jgi:hypothetical protein
MGCSWLRNGFMGGFAAAIGNSGGSAAAIRNSHFAIRQNRAQALERVCRIAYRVSRIAA